MQASKSNTDVMPPIPDRAPATGLPEREGQAVSSISHLRSGIAALGRRCLSLEQELATQAVAELQREATASLLISVYYDTGDGYSEGQKQLYIVEAEELEEVFITIDLPEDANAIRLDPGEQPCVITNLSFSDDRIVPVPSNGYAAGPDCFLFVRADPNISLTGKTSFPASEEIRCSFRYQEIKCAELCDAFDALYMQLGAQEAELHQCKREIEAMRNSTAWKLTAPIRALKRLLSRLFGGRGGA